MTTVNEKLEEIESLLTEAEALYDTPGTESQIYGKGVQAVGLLLGAIAQKLTQNLPSSSVQRLTKAATQLRELLP